MVIRFERLASKTRVAWLLFGVVAVCGGLLGSGRPAGGDESDPRARSSDHPPGGGETEVARTAGTGDPAPKDAIRVALERALQEARNIDDPLKRVRALVCVAEGLARAGDRPAAGSALDQALKEVKSVSVQDERESILHCNLVLQIGNAQALAGEWDKAKETAEAIAEHAPPGFSQPRWLDGWRAYVLARVAESQARSGRMDEARRTADSIGDDQGKAEALEAVALARAKTGDWKPARDLAAAIQDRESRARALLRLAKLQVAASRPAEAAELLAGAVRAIDGLPEDATSSRAILLLELVEAQLDMGALEAAKKTIPSIPRVHEAQMDWPYRERAILRLKVKEGDFAGALAVARSIRGSDMGLVAEAQAKAGDFAGALRTIAQIEHDFSRATALASIGRLQARAGDTTGATGSFGEALQVARRVAEVVNRIDGGDPGRPRLLREIAATQAEAGQEVQVSTWIADLSSPNLRAWALAGLADGLARRPETGKPLAGS
jgi:tetratricopeptide (TPR) repeat protein